jgi:hypothetical protein
LAREQRGGYVFIWWRGEPPPRNVHVYRGGRFVVKWDLDNNRPMRGWASQPRPVESGAGIPADSLKVRAIRRSNSRKLFDVRIGSSMLPFPYSKAEPAPRPGDVVVRAFIDEELDREAFSYQLESGRLGSVHVEQVLAYNQDPSYLRDQLLYRLTLEAQKRLSRSPLAKREIVRRLGSSAMQLYRLLDQTDYAKSVDQLLALLRVLECDVDLVVRARTA